MTSEFDIRKYKKHLHYQRIVRRGPVTFRSVVQEWAPFGRRAVVVIAAVVLVIVACRMANAADNELSSTSLPDAPSSSMAMMKAALPPAPPQFPHDNWLTQAIESKAAYRGSQWFLIGATAFDAVQTWRGLTHPTQLSADYCDATGCHTASFDFTSRFKESGWARFVGPRDAGGVVAANVALNAGVLFLSHELAKKGPRWRAVGTMLNSAKAVDGVVAASGWNAQFSYVDGIASKYPPQSVVWKP